MLRWFVLFCLVQALVAFPDPSLQDDVEEFQKYLKKTQEEREETLEEAMSECPLASPWENSGKYQGDILLRDEEVEEMVNEYANRTDHTRNGVVNTARRWPARTVHYEIAPNTFTAAQIRMIDDGARWFQQNSCVRWVRRTNQRAFVRITGRRTGCYAHVGHWPNFVHTLNLAIPGCMNRFIIIHEMLHTVGFEHMHQTYTRNDWVQINLQNVMSGYEFAFALYGRNRVSLFNTRYEYASNQHYGRYAFSRNRQPTVVARFAGGSDMGQRRFISAGDITRLRRMYTCPGAFDVELTEDEINKPMTPALRKRFDDAEAKAIVNNEGQEYVEDQ